MPKGYSGAPAKRYFRACEEAMEEAHIMFRSASSNTPSLPDPILRKLPFTEADAVFRDGVTAGLLNSSNIVASLSAYSDIANQYQATGKEVCEMLQHLCDETSNVMDESLILPQTSVQVKLVAQMIRSVLPELRGVHEEAAVVTNRMAESMLNIAGGSSDGFELHRPTADACRSENESCMRLQALDMRDYGEQARARAAEYEAQADALRPLLSAMRVESNGRRSWLVPDWPVRDRARADIDRLMNEAWTYRAEAARLDGAASVLEDEIRYSGRIFETDCDECVACDAHYASEFQYLADEMLRIMGKFQMIHDSFCPADGVINFEVLRDVKLQLPQVEHMSLYLWVAEHLMIGYSLNWDRIGELLQTNVSELMGEQLAGLAMVYLEMSDFEDIQRFISLGYRQVPILRRRESIGIDYVLTDTFRAVAGIVVESVTELAAITVWSGRSLSEDGFVDFEDAVVRRYIENMQVLQIVGTLGAHIRAGFNETLPRTVMDSGVSDGSAPLGKNERVTRRESNWGHPELSEFPILLGRNDVGNLMMRIASRSYSGENIPTQFGMLSEAFPVGTRGVSTVAPDSVGLELFTRALNLYVGGNWSALGYTANKLIGEARSKTIESIFTSAMRSGAGVATKGVTLAAGIVSDYFKYLNRARTASQMLEEYRFNFYLNRIGASVNYSNINGQIVMHGVNLDTSTSRMRHTMFNYRTGLDISKEELIGHVLSGDGLNEVYSKFGRLYDERLLNWEMYVLERKMSNLQ